MHRSGTSALARVLNLLGCGLANKILGAEPANETGHWEPYEIIMLNESILESAGSAWDDWTSISNDWLNSTIAEEFRMRGTHLYSSEYAEQSLTVMKDPRLARLLPFWLSILRSVDVVPVVMIPIRNPLEVAQSLQARNGFDTFYSELLWLRHVLDAEAGSRGVARHFSTYDQLLDSWTSLISSAESKLGFKFPRRSTRTSEEVDAYLAERHRHHRHDPKSLMGNAAASDLLKSTYAIMLKWSETGEDPKDYAQLDSVRSELDRSAGTFSRLIYRGKKAVEEVNGLRHLLAERDQQTANLRGDFEHISNIANQREHEIGALQNQISGEHARSADMEAQLHATNAALASLTESSAATEAHLRHELETLRAHADAERATSESALHATEERLQQTQTELSATLDHVNAVQAARQADQAESDAKQGAAHAEISGLQAQLASAVASHQEHVVGLEAGLSQEQAIVRGLTDKVALLLQEIETAKEEAEARLSAKSEEHDTTRAGLEAALEKEQAIVKGLTDHVALLLQDIDSAKQAGEAAIQAMSMELVAAQSNLQVATQKLDEALSNRSIKEAEVDKLAATLAQLESAMCQRGAELDDVNGELKRVTEILHVEKHERVRVDTILGGLKSQIKSLMEDIDKLGTELSAKINQTQLLLLDKSALQGDLEKLKAQMAEHTDNLLQGLIAERHSFIVTRGEHLRRKAELLRKSGIISRKAYLQANPDVAQAGLEPEFHYLSSGYAEGRKISE
jgi:hypothetical protein